MEPVLIGLGVFLLILLAWFAGTYNGLVKTRNHCDESWAGIDTELKRRYDLIPNLVATVKGYAQHEGETLEAVVRARNAAVASTGSPESQARDENALVRSLRGMLAVVERYPDLKANQNYLALQVELVNTEDRIQRSRRFYNANVRDLANRIEAFPSNLVAGMFKFVKREFFEIEEAAQRAVPEVRP
ncbi:MAG: LemA family protein [Planctomycetes bacterium]|nr:LemA family protein [Planctomycetota bacterium]